jgi:hypothetical protein
MSGHIQRFVDRVQGHEARGSRDFVMSLADAKDLHADITRLLANLQNLQEQAVATADSDQAITVQITGGTF